MFSNLFRIAAKNDPAAVTAGGEATAGVRRRGLFRGIRTDAAAIKRTGKHISLVPYDILVILFLGQSMLPGWAALLLAAVNFGTWWCYYRIPQFLRTVSGPAGQSILIPGPIVEYFARFINSCGIHHRAHYGLMLAMMAGFHAAMTGVIWDEALPQGWAYGLGWTCYGALLFIDSAMYWVSLRTLQELRLDKLHEASRYTEELKRSNEDLEQFAYIASHDLRAPLRGIMNLSQWIREDIGTDCSEETRKHLDLLQNRVNRMDHLLNDLLEYSRIGREETPKELIDLEDLTKQIFAAVDSEQKFSLHVAAPAEPLVDYRITYELLLGNLIGNAIKHHDKGAGTIWVTIRKGSHSMELKVEDDGPGIAESYRDKIFEVFSTLQPRDQKEASGMGLAIVKKIATHKKGMVSVTDSEHGGACFTVVMPLSYSSPETLEPVAGKNE